MNRPRMMMTLALAGLASACGPSIAERVPPAPAPAASMVDPENVEPVHEQVTARVLVVTYVGAENAPDEITRSRSDALARADMIRQMANAPQTNFGALAREFGDVPVESGRRGIAQRVRMDQSALPRAIRKVALTLDVGEVSGLVDMASGFVIVARDPDPDQARLERIGARHILISYQGASRASDSVTRSKGEAQERAQLVARLAKAEGANWEELHAQYTDEPGSPPGGDLGEFERGRMVPAFERAAFRLEIGDISDPVESPFGYHVITRYR